MFSSILISSVNFKVIVNVLVVVPLSDIVVVAAATFANIPLFVSAVEDKEPAAKFVAMVGEDEIKSGELTIKDMRSGDQSKMKVYNNRLLR